MLQDFKSVSDHFTTLHSKRLKVAIDLVKTLESTEFEKILINTETKAENAFTIIKQKYLRWYQCNSDEHLANTCPFKMYVCNTCKMKSNLSKACRKGSKRFFSRKQKTQDYIPIINFNG